MHPIKLNSVYRLSIAGTCLLLCQTSLSAQRAEWAGESALKSHREKLYNRPAQAGGQSASTATSSGSSTRQSSQAGQPAIAPKPAKPKSLTVAQIQAAKAASAQARKERQVKAQTQPLVVTWPTAPQPALSWKRSDIEFDNYTVSKSQLTTSKQELVSELLVGYQPTDVPSGKAGLTLVNRVRSDLQVDYYTFPKEDFLPDIEPETIDAYLKAVAKLHKDKTLQPIELEEAKSGYGPSAADLNTRRITYQLVENNGPDGSQTVAAVITDYLLPFEDEWLVVRFTAPDRLYQSAREPIESYLLNMSAEAHGTEFSSL